MRVKYLSSPLGEGEGVGLDILYKENYTTPWNGAMDCDLCPQTWDAEQVWGLGGKNGRKRPS